MLSTTLNIHVDVFAKITQEAVRLKKSRKFVIILLFMQIMKNYQLFMRGFSTVKYQPDDAKKNWHCFHIRFREDENEFFVDLRKVCKFSVSYLLAKAVDLYLDKLWEEDLEKSVDNYRTFNNYVLHHTVIDGIISLQSYWGYPEKHLKTLHL